MVSRASTANVAAGVAAAVRRKAPKVAALLHLRRLHLRRVAEAPSVAAQVQVRVGAAAVVVETHQDPSVVRARVRWAVAIRQGPWVARAPVRRDRWAAEVRGQAPAAAGAIHPDLSVVQAPVRVGVITTMMMDSAAAGARDMVGAVAIHQAQLVDRAQDQDGIRRVRSVDLAPVPDGAAAEIRLVRSAALGLARAGATLPVLWVVRAPVPAGMTQIMTEIVGVMATVGVMVTVGAIAIVGVTATAGAITTGTTAVGGA